MSTGLDLGKQVGPLPVGGWVVVVGGGLAIAYFVNKGQARQDARIEPLVEEGVGTGLVPAGAIIQPYQPPEDTVDEDNSAWGRKVLNWLIGSGSDPATADNAVRKYLSGENLTVQENALINLALVKFGSPPEALPPVKVPTIPTPATPTPVDVGRPLLAWTQPPTRRRGTRVPIKGRISIGGKVPVLPTNRIIRVTVFMLGKPATTSNIYQRFYITANSKGEINTSTGWGISSRGWRWYQLYYKGVIVNRRVTFT